MGQNQWLHKIGHTVNPCSDKMLFESFEYIEERTSFNVDISSNNDDETHSKVPEPLCRTVLVTTGTTWNVM